MMMTTMTMKLRMPALLDVISEFMNMSLIFVRGEQMPKMCVMISQKLQMNSRKQLKD